jgi:acetyl/propionyl-CoA carboxylase alpha subunit
MQPQAEHHELGHRHEAAASASLRSVRRQARSAGLPYRGRRHSPCPAGGLRAKQLRAATIAEGRGRHAHAAPGDTLSRDHRQHAPVKSVDLVARVQGFLQSIEYQDGAFVKEGTTLFTIEPETYQLKLEQAQAAEAGAQASVRQAEADFKRQSDLVARQAVSQATLDNSTSRTRQRPGQSASGRGQHRDRRGQPRLHQ